MYIVGTNRIIQQAYQYKKNYDQIFQIASLEPKIDGAKINNPNPVPILECKNLFFQFARDSGVENPEKYFQVQQIYAYDFFMNPYLKNIHLQEIHRDSISLELDYYAPNEFVILDEPKQSSDLTRVYSVGVFDQAATTYILKTEEEVWMSVNPMEIQTAKKGLSHARGNSLVLGGGLGYFAYLASMKEEVNTVTIIESDPVIYDLLNGIILPQFSRDNTKIILDDAYDFLRKTKPGDYDSVYIDTWKGKEDGFIQYKKFLKLEEKYPSMVFDYWLEDSFLNDTAINICQYLNAKLGTKDYQKYFSMIAGDLWNALETNKSMIKRPDQISYYFRKEFAKEILKAS